MSTDEKPLPITLAVYAPRRLKEKDFLAAFIARQELLEFLLKELRRIPRHGEARHRMVAGQRGMGKTSLLRRLAIAIARDDDLKGKLLPLTFREEQYNVRSLDQFWRNCGEALAEWLEESGAVADAERLDREMRQPDWQTPDGAAEAFRARVAATGRRPVLLVDNLDLVLDALPPDQHWQLRRALQAADGPVLYGAAVQGLTQSGDHGAAFYEFFRFDRLEPLGVEELLECLRRLALSRGEAGRPVIRILDQEPQRLRVLHTLTGGNPRVLTLIYQLLERAEGEEKTDFSDLEGLLDQMTPFYKARVEELRTELQRAMLDAVALHWDPITSNGVAEASGVEITTVSSQLNRLKLLGLIEEVPTSGSRAGYQLVERFFNIWYLMRHGTRHTRQRLRWLTAFLQTFYTGDELHRLRGPATAWPADYAEALEAALEEVEKKRAAVAGPVQSDRGRAFAQWQAGLDHKNMGRYAEAEAAYREAIRIDPKFTWVWNSLGILLMDHLGRPAEAEAAYREAIRLNPKDAIPWSNLGWLFTKHLIHPVEAEAAYREAIQLDPKLAMPWRNLAVLLMQHLGRLAEAEAACREAIRLDPKFAMPWHNLGILLKNHLGRPGEAEAAFREAIRLDPKDASAWNGLGNVLVDLLQRPEEGERAYRQAIALGGEGASSAQANLVWLLLDRGQGDEARALRPAADGLAPVWHDLTDAALELAADNFGAATRHLDAALAPEHKVLNSDHFDDLMRLLRLFERRGYGERLISWLEQSGHDGRYAPLYQAFVAYVRGERLLLDVNPEVRQPAERLYHWLASCRPAPPPAAAAAPPKRRGRPRRLG